MARRPERKTKSQSRAEREAQMRLYVYIASGVVVGLVVILIAVGVIQGQFIQPNRAVATVNGVNIPLKDFEMMVRLQHNTYSRTIQQYQQFVDLFPDQPSLTQSYQDEIARLVSQLGNPTLLGSEVLDTMIDSEIIRQEAEAAGITVSQEELDRYFEENTFGYYRDGTPTPLPTDPPPPTFTATATVEFTSTPDATATAVAEATGVVLTQAWDAFTTELAAATATAATPGPSPTPSMTPSPTLTITPGPSPTPVPSLTPTPYTEALFDEDFALTVENLDVIAGMTVDDYIRLVVEPQLLRERLRDELFTDVETTEREANANHILLPEDQLETAEDVLQRALDGEDFAELAAEFGTDSTAQNGGSLGWFGLGQMVPEFEKAVFNANVGVIPELVQTQFGYHIIEVVEFRDRDLSESEIEQQRATELDLYLETQRIEGDVQTFPDFWERNIPAYNGPLNLSAAAQSEPVQDTGGGTDE